MKKILAPVDGSISSIHAARTAVTLAKALGGEVTLLYVAAPLDVYGVEMLGATNEIRAAVFEGGQQALREVQAEIAKLEANVSTLIREGPVPETIVSVTEEGGYDMVVIGSRGRGAITRLLLGSVSDRVVHICPRPILVVR